MLGYTETHVWPSLLFSKIPFVFPLQKWSNRREAPRSGWRMRSRISRAFPEEEILQEMYSVP